MVLDRPQVEKRQALEWTPQGKRKVGRPKQTWRRTVAAEMKKIGLTWPEVKRVAQDRTRWRSTIDALCPTWGPYDIKSIFCAKINCISAKKTASNETIHPDGVAKTLGIWPLLYKQESTVLSTFPVRLALNKLAAAADGQAKTELMTSLGVNDTNDLTKFYAHLYSKLKCLIDTDLIMLNKIYINPSSSISSRFLDDSFKNFGVQIEKIHFQIPAGVVSFANQWADTATLKRIPKLLSTEDVQQNFNMIILNAVHMKPTWETPFDIRLSRMRLFHSQNKSIETRMMTFQEKMLNYYKDNHNKFKVLMLHLACNGCKITYFLPFETNGLRKMVKLFLRKPEVLQNAVKNLKMQIINIELPVLKIRSKMTWSRYLNGLGIKKIFDPSSPGLNSINQGGKRKYFLGTAIQKVFVEIDEYGVYREAPYDRPNYPEVHDNHVVENFIADHPFLFKIEIEDLEENNTSHELLTGVFYGTEI